MKVIFLDFDGVLNHDAHFATLPSGRTMADCLDDDLSFDKACVARLNEIVRRSGAKVVVSSSWRCLYSMPDIRGILLRHGFSGDVVDRTPRLHRDPNGKQRTRGDEICGWLAATSRKIDAFVILDDDSDMGSVANRLVQTSLTDGLMDEHVERAVEILCA